MVFQIIVECSIPIFVQRNIAIPVADAGGRTKAEHELVVGLFVGGVAAMHGSNVVILVVFVWDGLEIWDSGGFCTYAIKIDVIAKII